MKAEASCPHGCGSYTRHSHIDRYGCEVYFDSPSPEPTFPSAWTISGACGERAVLTVADAWAWRCADTMPDTAQGRRDSDADARALKVAMPELCTAPEYGQRPGPGCEVTAGHRIAIKRGSSDYGPHQAARGAAAAFRACPGLRG